MFSPHSAYDTVDRKASSSSGLLLFDLLFLYILVLNGLARSLSDLSKLTLPDGRIPRGRWLLVVCGITTVISGHMSGPPILISPESAAGVKAGAKTGFSTLICGMCYGVSTFFAPFFAEIPAAGTAPLLIMVGVLLFQNAKRIDWYQPNYAVPAFCCLFFIPFTYSILRGVAFGYATYILIGIFTGDFWIEFVTFLRDYLGPLLVSTYLTLLSSPVTLISLSLFHIFLYQNKNDYVPAPTLLGSMELRTVWSNPVTFFWNILNSDFMNAIDGGIAPMDIDGIENLLCPINCFYVCLTSLIFPCTYIRRRNISS
jgi:AGZA family xanthine/uracil permease-like MFS transporter